MSDMLQADLLSATSSFSRALTLFWRAFLDLLFLSED